MDAPRRQCIQGVANGDREASKRQLVEFGLDSIRYVAGHMPMGVHPVFDRSTKYFTILRHPVDRVISLFYFLIQLGVPLRKDGKRLTFEDYIENRSDINLCDYQVRAVSGCAELDAPRGRPMRSLTPCRWKGTPGGGQAQHRRALRCGGPDSNR